MLMINFTEPLHLAIALILFVAVLWLGKQFKKSVLVGLMLFIFITVLIGHIISLNMGNPTELETEQLVRSVILDAVFVFLSFISYLWIDDIEAKFKKKKSIDNSLDWFWSKV